MRNGKSTYFDETGFVEVILEDEDLEYGVRRLHCLVWGMGVYHGCSIAESSLQTMKVGNSMLRF